MIYFGYHKCCCFKIINIYELLILISLLFQMNRNYVSWTLSRFKLFTHYFIKNKSFHLINVYIFKLKSKLQKHKACQWKTSRKNFLHIFLYQQKSYIWWIIWRPKYILNFYLNRYIYKISILKSQHFLLSIMNKQRRFVSKFSIKKFFMY